MDKLLGGLSFGVLNGYLLRMVVADFSSLDLYYLRCAQLFGELSMVFHLGKKEFQLSLTINSVAEGPPPWESSCAQRKIWGLQTSGKWGASHNLQKFLS